MITILYRAAYKWHLWKSAVHLEDAEQELSRCQRGTASPWVWMGLDRIGMWRLRNQTTDKVPVSVVKRAHADLNIGLSRARRAVTLGEGLIETLKPRRSTKEAA